MNNTLIIVGVIVVIAILGFYFYNKNNQAKIAADVQLASIAAEAPVECIPFTKAQQDVEKRNKQAKCANKILIPFVGVTQFTACMKNIAAELTPVKNC